MGIGQLAVVTDVVKVLVILLDGSSGGEAGASAMVFSDEEKERKN